jgi:hypothetical protein
MKNPPVLQPSGIWFSACREPVAARVAAVQHIERVNRFFKNIAAQFNSISRQTQSLFAAHARPGSFEEVIKAIPLGVDADAAAS